MLMKTRIEGLDSFAEMSDILRSIMGDTDGAYSDSTENHVEVAQQSFTETLKYKLSSTSTPHPPRSHNITNDLSDLSKLHDSGFYDCEHSNSQSFQKQSSVNDTSSNNGIGVDSAYSSQDSTKEPLHEGLKKLQTYFDGLRSRCPLDKVIGLHIGVEQFDILLGLYKLDIPCLDMIIAQLKDKDLLNCEMVSSEWKSMCSRSKHFHRRLSCIKDKQVSAGKENASPVKDGETTTNNHASSGKPLSVLKGVNNQLQDSASDTSPEQFPDSPLFNKFFKAARKLKTGEQLTKCPRCSGPALLRQQEKRALCKMKSCQYDFCTLCELSFHGVDICKPNKTQLNSKAKRNQSINSKGSRKRLKRL